MNLSGLALFWRFIAFHHSVVVGTLKYLSMPSFLRINFNRIFADTKKVADEESQQALKKNGMPGPKYGEVSVFHVEITGPCTTIFDQPSRLPNHRPVSTPVYGPQHWYKVGPPEL